MKFQVKRSEWLRGEGYMCSRLLRKDDNKKCCFGFGLLALGITEDEICDIGAPGEINK